MLRLEGGIDLTAGVVGILPLANGGTETALVDPDEDSLYMWDDSETETAFIELSTDGTLGDNSDDAVPTEKAVKTYADSIAFTSGLAFVSRLQESNTATTSDIAITAGVKYRIVIKGKGTSRNLSLRFNNASSTYAYEDGYGNSPTTGASEIVLGTAKTEIFADFIIDWKFNDVQAVVMYGFLSLEDDIGDTNNFVGYWDGGANPTSFDLTAATGPDWDWDITVWKFNTS